MRFGIEKLCSLFRIHSATLSVYVSLYANVSAMNLCSKRVWLYI